MQTPKSKLPQDMSEILAKIKYVEIGFLITSYMQQNKTFMRLQYVTAKKHV
jgi:hypothetical protein